MIEKDPILFYIESASDSQYMMFKSQNEIDHDKFKRIVDSVRVAIGFLSGLYIGDNVYYFACNINQGIKGLTYKYMNLQESVISKYPILDYSFYRDITEEELILTSSQFNKLVELIYINDNIMRAAMLITNAGTLSGVSKGTLASVALETMTSVVMSEQKAENIVEDKKVYRQLEYELKKGLKKIKSSVLQERYTILENKLQQINYMPNSNKLEKPFELMDVILDDEEKDIIKCRNKFLHGVLPSLKKFKFLNEEESVFLFSNKLAMLSAMLILRKIGYEGRVIDWGTTEVMKKRMILRRERVEEGNALRRVISTSDDQQQDESKTENV